MIRSIAILLVVLVTAGFGSCGGVRSAPPSPVDAHCDAMCHVPCVDANGDTGVRWDADPKSADAMDVLGGDVVPLLAEKLRTCETHRKACQQCLDRLQHEGVIL